LYEDKSKAFTTSQKHLATELNLKKKCKVTLQKSIATNYDTVKELGIEKQRFKTCTENLAISKSQTVACEVVVA